MNLVNISQCAYVDFIIENIHYKFNITLENQLNFTEFPRIFWQIMYQILSEEV